MNIWQRYVRRLRIWETNYGRDAGWIVEYQGKPLAILTCPGFVDQFWVSYWMEVVCEDAALCARLLSEEGWPLSNEDHRQLTWRNRELGLTVPIVSVAGMQFGPRRVVVRGLSLYPGWMMPWDCLALLCRQLWRLMTHPAKEGTG